MDVIFFMTEGRGSAMQSVCETGEPGQLTGEPVTPELKPVLYRLREDDGSSAVKDVMGLVET